MMNTGACGFGERLPLGGRKGGPVRAPAGDQRPSVVRSLGPDLETQCQLPLAWFDVLLRLRQNADGRLKMNEMANAIVHSTGGTTRLVDRLEEAGLRPSRALPERPTRDLRRYH